jgi:hypothetical protein
MKRYMSKFVQTLGCFSTLVTADLVYAQSFEEVLQVKGPFTLLGSKPVTGAFNVLEIEMDPAKLGTRFAKKKSDRLLSKGINLGMFFFKINESTLQFRTKLTEALPVLIAPSLPDEGASQIDVGLTFLPGFAGTLESESSVMEAIQALGDIKAISGKLMLRVTAAKNRYLYYRHQTSGEIVVNDRYCSEVHTYRYTLEFRSMAGQPKLPRVLEGLKLTLEDLDLSVDQPWSAGIRTTRNAQECIAWRAEYH